MEESHTEASGFSTLMSPNRTCGGRNSPTYMRSAFSIHSPSPKGKRVVNNQSRFEKEDLNLNSKALRHRIGLTGENINSPQIRHPISNENECILAKSQVTSANVSTKCLLLDSLPNKGILQNIQVKTPDNAYDSKKPNVRGKECTQTAMPSLVVTYDAGKNCQILKTDNRNVLVRSLTIRKQELGRRNSDLEKRAVENKSRSEGFACIKEIRHKYNADRSMNGATPKRPRTNNSLPATTPGNDIASSSGNTFQTPNPARQQDQSPQEMQQLCVSPRLGASRVVTPPPTQTLEPTLNE